MIEGWKSCKQFWNKHGWHILLVGLLIVFFILFLVNQFGNHASSRSVSISDIYDHFMSYMFNPHTQSRQHQTFRRPASPSRTHRQGNMSKGESKCKEFIEFFFQQPFEKCRPQFLQNPVTKENLELDLYNTDLKLAIEYNGSQHYHYNSFMHGNSKDRFYNQQYRDLIKHDLCKKNGIQLIVVPYTVPESGIAGFIFEELKKLGYSPHPDALGKLT